jgi:hypothetical protein
MQLLPFALALELLRVGFLAGLNFVGLSCLHIVRQMYIHSYEIEHASLIYKVGVSQVHQHRI